MQIKIIIIILAFIALALSQTQGLKDALNCLSSYIETFRPRMVLFHPFRIPSYSKCSKLPIRTPLTLLFSTSIWPLITNPRTSSQETSKLCGCEIQRTNFYRTWKSHKIVLKSNSWRWDCSILRLNWSWQMLTPTLSKNIKILMYKDTSILTIKLRLSFLEFLSIYLVIDNLQQNQYGRENFNSIH